MARAAGRVDIARCQTDVATRCFQARRCEPRPSPPAAAALCGASARAEDCGHGPEGFSQWLNSFKQVAQGNGVSADAVDRGARRAFPMTPTVKRHDGGVAMFGHNFAGFAASHVTPGMVARGKAELKRYAEPLARRSSSASACPGRCWWRSGARRPVSAATAARFRPTARSRRSPGTAAAPSGIAPNWSTP